MWITTEDYAVMVQIVGSLIFVITAIGTWLTKRRIFGYGMFLSGVVVIAAISVVANLGIGT